MYINCRTFRLGRPRQHESKLTESDADLYMTSLCKVRQNIIKIVPGISIGWKAKSIISVQMPKVFNLMKMHKTFCTIFNLPLNSL